MNINANNFLKNWSYKKVKLSHIYMYVFPCKYIQIKIKNLFVVINHDKIKYSQHN